MSRDWVVFSSSSGETLQALWRGLGPAYQKSFRSLFTDRDCGAKKIAEKLSLACAQFEKWDFEDKVLIELSRLSSNTVILLCGFFGILSEKFLLQCPFPIINTHPSLLPAFPGLDKKVHQTAHQQVCVSGFSVHLVTELLDGGTILFQHPVWMDSTCDWETNRKNVRLAEQKYLPLFWQKILESDLKKEDQKLSSHELRLRLNFNQPYFEEKRI